MPFPRQAASTKSLWPPIVPEWAVQEPTNRAVGQLARPQGGQEVHYLTVKRHAVRVNSALGCCSTWFILGIGVKPQKVELLDVWTWMSSVKEEEHSVVDMII